MKKLIIGAVGVFLILTTDLSAETLAFSGHKWRVRGYEGMPGPNQFSTRNAWVDEEGALHLRIRNEGGKWTCAEVIAEGDFQFGRYAFAIEGPVGKLDPQVVFGLFTYPRAETGKSGTHEIDIEFARWGNAAYPNLNYTVWPAKEGVKQTSESREVKFAEAQTQHTFIWEKERVLFASFAGEKELAGWIFAPEDAAERISQAPQQLMINLWLMDGKPPGDGQEVEVIVRRFVYEPAPKSN